MQKLTVIRNCVVDNKTISVRIHFYFQMDPELSKPLEMSLMEIQGRKLLIFSVVSIGNMTLGEITFYSNLKQLEQSGCMPGKFQYDEE